MQFDYNVSVINNALMEGKTETYVENAEFLEFLSREFDRTAEHATVEELAEFAFGSVEAAIEGFEESRKQ